MKFFITLIFIILSNFIHYTLTVPVKTGEQISKSLKCADDIKTLCGDLTQTTDVAILTCLQDSDDVMRKISTKCQHFLWEYKHNLTKSPFFDKITEEQCSKDLNMISECKEAKIGMKTPCLVDHKDKVNEDKCSRFLNDISVIIFSDYHVIYKFVDKCMADITKYRCGRITKPGAKDVDEKLDENENPINENGVNIADYVTSQAHTLDCLIDHIQDIGKDCQHQILRVSELQSNDYHLNRGLYLACRDDREALCPRVKSGEGRVYSCLMKEKFNNEMSAKCKQELTRKQQVESLDVKADYPLFRNCKEDIITNRCLKNVSGIQHDVVLMSVILMCLHDAEIHGKKLNPNCKGEIDERKAEMIADFKISPAALTACKKEVSDTCKKEDNEPGEVIHCLMKLAEPNLKQKSTVLSETCRNALITVIKVANPTDNLMSGDAAIREACSSSFQTLCADSSTDKESFQCLVNHLNSPKMAQKCRDKMTSLLYFISLDIMIDENVNKACHNDAVRLCKEPDSFEDSQKPSQIDKQVQYHCMYEYFKKDKIILDIAKEEGTPMSKIKLSLSTECSNRLFSLIKVQASKIELDPIVFVPCFDDIGKYCDNDEYRGKEHECLQKNIKLLEKSCHKAVIEFSQLENVDSRLNRMLSDACVPMIEKFCSHQKPEKMIVCLTEHKFHPQMSPSCHAAIEHIQITSLEEYHIDHRFASFCGPEIDKYCSEELLKDSPDGPDGKGDRNNKIVGKATIVSCLSRTVTNKLLKGEKNPLSDRCRRQFTFELLQRSNSIKLDPGLNEDCGEDIKRFCTNVPTKEINSCLRKKQDNLKTNCHRRLFRRERLESLDADFDGELQKVCSEMIHKYCHNVPGKKLFRCLHHSMKVMGFDSECTMLIQTRLERRMNDIRLNPGLIKVCRNDIGKYCHITNDNIDSPESGIEHEGRVILCLRTQYTNSSKSLSSECRQRILEIIIESNTNIRLDPTLRKQCSKDMNELCKNDMINQYEDTVNSVHNCLKHSFLRDKLITKGCKSEVARMLREGKADVHVDGELFDACEEAIMNLCRTEGFGEGRKMSCLLTLVEEPNALKMMKPRCVTMIKERRQMWQMAGNYESQSLQDLYQHVKSSSTRIYLVSMLGLIVASLILLGICCGRVTKRVAVDLKNK